jgi:hypothetical protein
MTDIVPIPAAVNGKRGSKLGLRKHMTTVLDIIRENGPVAPDEIARLAGIAVSSVRYTVSLAREKELIHVADFDRHTGRQGRWAKQYAIGKKRDAKEPVNDQAEYQRAYQENNARLALKRRDDRRKKSGKPKADPFALALQIFQMASKHN